MIKHIKHHKERSSQIFLLSDLLVTRSVVGASSLLFSLILTVHYFHSYHLYDLFWILFSFIHASFTLFSLYTSKSTLATFLGEAVCGFVLWNYISFSLISVFLNMELLSNGLLFSTALFAPTFIIGITTWWILSRYPKITK